MLLVEEAGFRISCLGLKVRDGMLSIEVEASTLRTHMETARPSFSIFPISDCIHMYAYLSINLSIFLSTYIDKGMYAFMLGGILNIRGKLLVIYLYEGLVGMHLGLRPPS